MNRPIEEVEEARLRPMSVEEYPWISQQVDTNDPQYAPIRAANTKEPPKWFQEAQGRSMSQRSARSAKSGGLNRYGSTRSTRSGPRESIVDLHLLVSDLDFYAGAVHDFQEEAEEDEWISDEEYELEAPDNREWPLPRDSNGMTYGQISIQRNISTRSKKSMKDPDLVTWDGPDDPENPKNWTRKRKWAATAVVSLFTFISPVSSSMVAPALADVAQDFGVPLTEANLAMSVFVLAFAVGPLFLGPISELFGRALVLQISNMVYFAFNLGCGFSQNINQLIVFRFFSGLGGSAPLGLGAGVLADIWLPQERGKAIGMYSLAPLLGPAVGPIAGGFIAQYAPRTPLQGWRWVFYSTCIVTIFIQILGIFYLQETYEAELLKRKKKRLIKMTGNTELHTTFDNPNRKFIAHLSTALVRPVRMLTTQPIVIVLALYIGYVYGVLYLVLASFPVLWQSKYGEGPAIGGLNYISLGVGFFVGTQIAAKVNDRVYKKLKAENDGMGRSEFRVPLMVPGSILVPVGLFIYGWTAQNRVFWLVPNIGTAIFAAGNQMVFQCCQTYIVDAYTRYAASAIAATTVLRSLGGFAFPLFAQQMYDALGYGWGNSVLAFAGIALGVPMPFFLWFYGASLRAKSTFAAG
ncbi:MFS general substrate transporter [Polychaeton citri CBS 116435]|uniref:Cercosporin MFS transporter CTB4 n=1 Tax=Polychaeton citri CBS 116435 TaxID=1314669 RepID=A0A9P4QER4_9PEZI|nr:MFS general substrate transporter [Polychaeton citri CBS 116435]